MLVHAPMETSIPSELFSALSDSAQNVTTVPNEFETLLIMYRLWSGQPF
jgi:hypothetical protein